MPRQEIKKSVEDDGTSTEEKAQRVNPLTLLAAKHHLALLLLEAISRDDAEVMEEMTIPYVDLSSIALRRDAQDAVEGEAALATREELLEEALASLWKHILAVRGAWKRDTDGSSAYSQMEQLFDRADEIHDRLLSTIETPESDD